MKLILGIDIGVNNVGYGLINNENGEIIKAGVRLFEESKRNANEDRRSNRHLRRQIRRKQHRLKMIKDCLVKYGFPIDKQSTNPYEIRRRAIYEKVEPWELSVALLHIAKRRGTTLDVPEDEKATDNELSTKEQIKINDEALKDKYVCELQLERLANSGVRNYTNKFRVSDYLKEVNAILNNQKQYYGDTFDAFTNEYLKLLQNRRNYYDGPGSEKSPTIYGQYFYDENGKLKHIGMIEKMKGKCTFFPDEPRIAKMTYTADLFNMLNDLNNITFCGNNLTKEDKEYLINKFVDNGKNLTPTQVIKYIKANYDDVGESQISGFRVDLKKNKELLTEFKGFNTIRKYAEKNNLPKVIYEDKELLDEIIEILTDFKDFENRRKKLSELLKPYLSEDEANAAINILQNDTEIKGYHSLSRCAIESILDDLWETSDNQMQLFTQKGFFAQNNAAKKGKNIVFDDTAILSTVAKRAHREAIKIINALREKYGELDGIVIEMAREKNSDEQKDFYKQLQKKQGDFEKKLATQFKVDNIKELKFSGKQILAFKLLEEQDGKSVYSNKPITYDDIRYNFSRFEIDHIIPLSISYDDSQSNKVLCYQSENQAKGQRTPFEYLSSGKGAISYAQFKAEVQRLYKSNKKKIANLLEERDIIYNEELKKQFINRNLVDTRYACRSLMSTLKDYFAVNDIPTKVYSIRGSFTYAFRKTAGLNKDRDESYKHHAIDALIVAGMTKVPSFNDLKKYTLNNDDSVVDKETGEILTTDEYFDKKVLRYVRALSEYDNILFSHKVDRKVNRAIVGKQTIYGTKAKDGEEYAVNKYSNIYTLGKNDCGKLIKALKENPEKFFVYENNKDVFEQLLKIVEQYKSEDNPFAAYKAEFGYVLKDGKVPVKALRYYGSKVNVCLPVTDKYINPKNSVVMLQMQYLRIDVYKNDKGYRFAALRYMDFLPKGTDFVISQQRYEERKAEVGIDNSYEFCFSLYKYDMFAYEIADKRAEMVLIGAKNVKNQHFEIKYVDKPREEKERIVGSMKSVTDIVKINTNVLGDKYYIKSEKEPKLSLQM